MPLSHDLSPDSQPHVADGHPRSRSIAALMAGTIAILANMAALELCDLIGIATAHGGLLKLVRYVTALPPLGAGGQQAFHFVVGLGMALVYGLVL